MHHLTLRSYRRNEPVGDPNDNSHPDGLLWPIHLSELMGIPTGLKIEHIDTGKNFTVGTMHEDEIAILADNDGYVNYGIRGWREEQQVR